MRGFESHLLLQLINNMELKIKSKKLDQDERVFKQSVRPYVILLSSIFLLFSILFSIIIFIIAVSVVFSDYWWVFLILTYFSSNLIISQVILSSEYNRHSKYSWLFIIWFFPFAGGSGYLIFGRIPITRHSKLKKALLDREETLEKNVDNKDVTKEMQLITKNLPRQVYNNSQIKIIQSSIKFQQLLEKLEEATSYVHMEYFIFKQGEIFYDLLDILTEKVKEGVEVKILVDDLGSGQTKKSEFQKFINAGIEFKLFNKVRPPIASGHLNLRLHRKVVIIDGKYGFIGGMNIGDEYIGTSKEFGDWIDSHAEVNGDILKTLSLNFLLDWKHSTKEDLLNNKKYKIPDSEIKSKDSFVILEDGPDVGTSSFENAFTNLTNNAQKRIWIVSPYLILNKKMTKIIISAAKNGVDVRVFVPGRYDKKIPHYISKHYLRKMSDNKVKIYRAHNLFVHSKMILWDEVGMLGTSNMDIRSIYSNYEINLFFQPKNNNKDFEKYFLELQELCEIHKPKYNSHYPWNWIPELFYWLMKPIF